MTPLVHMVFITLIVLCCAETVDTAMFLTLFSALQQLVLVCAYVPSLLVLPHNSAAHQSVCLFWTAYHGHVAKSKSIDVQNPIGLHGTSIWVARCHWQHTWSQASKPPNSHHQNTAPKVRHPSWFTTGVGVWGQKLIQKP